MSLVDRNGQPISTVDLFRNAANKAVIGPGANVYANGGLPLSGMSSRKYMEQAQRLYIDNPWIHTAEGLISKKLSVSDWKIMVHTTDFDTEKSVDSGPAYDMLDIGSPLQEMSRSKLWQITSRHMGLCNNAFWYPDRKQPENGCIYINPARMTPVPNEAGYLHFWLLDADDFGENGVRFEKDEILWFQLEAADTGFFGHGLVFSALMKATLSTATDRHAIQVLETGGRLQGILTPTKDDFINDFAFASMQRELRNVTELDDSAKRMVLLRKAVEFTPTTMTPNDLNLALLMRTSKEDIYEIWGVPRSQTGGMTEVGMNSGDRQSYEEAALQQNAIHPRVVVFEETVRKLLTTYDPRYRLVVQEPEFDDERPLYEMLKMSEYAPMSRNERRRLIKLPPMVKNGDVVEQNPGLLQIEPPLPIARSYITGRLQDGTTVDATDTPLDPQQHLDAINTARRAPKQTVGKAEAEEPGEVAMVLSKAIAERITEKADHFLAKPGDMDMIAPRKLVSRVMGSADALRDIHDALKAIVATGQANDWAVEEYAEAVRGSALVSDHLEHPSAPVEPAPPSAKADDGQVTVTLPRVTVQPTPVTIPAMDMTPIAKAISDMGQRIIEGMPEPTVVPPFPKPEKLRRVVERDPDGRIVAIVDVAV